MPTLQSLRVAPELLQKLRDDVQPPILTPLALLARDPASTAGQLRVPLSYWNQVRAHVADAILVQTSTDTVRIAAQQLEHDKQDGNKRLITGSLTALEYWRHSETRHASSVVIPGCTILSSWLSSSRLIQITGPSASGKTQLCLSLAVSSLQHEKQQQQHRVLYISTTTPPSALARRLRQLVASQHSIQQRHVLENINLMQLSTPHQLLTALHQVAENESSTTTCADSPKSLLLILDSASGCLGGCSDWNLLTQIGVTLKRLVHLTTAGEVRIVMTNGTTASGDSALGATWSARVPETHLRLAAKGPKVEATLRRNSHRPVETTHFAISAHGIQEQHVEPC
ncbi:hypothetical protein MHU86_18346 [Fragilaria crotonensis]|nr:hypothetical protein MHU86_18346 [Fragilaria crotonensis]